MPLPDPQFSSQDCQLVQPHQTLVYTKALQYWVEKAQLLIPCEPCHLAESVLQLQQAVEPLVIFTEEEVLAATVPSNWVQVSSTAWQNMPWWTPTTIVTAAKHGPTQGDPYWQPTMEINQPQPREETSLLLHLER